MQYRHFRKNVILQFVGLGQQSCKWLIWPNLFFTSKGSSLATLFFYNKRMVTCNCCPKPTNCTPSMLYNILFWKINFKNYTRVSTKLHGFITFCDETFPMLVMHIHINKKSIKKNKLFSVYMVYYIVLYRSDVIFNIM